MFVQRLCGYTKTGDTQRAFLPDSKHPKDALALAAAGQQIDWASPTPWCEKKWEGHTGINAAIMGEHLQDQPWRWGSGPRDEDAAVPREMMLCALEPDPRWCEFQNQRLTGLLTDLGPLSGSNGPVRIAWDPEDDDLIERLMAAIYRDGAVVLSNAVETESCVRVQADMAPYLDASGGGTAGALPARSQESWRMITHPFVLQVCDAVVGRQVLDMSKQEMQKNMRYPGRQVPWALSRTQISRTEQSKSPPLRRDSSYLELNLERTKRSLKYQVSAEWALHDIPAGDAPRFVPASHRWPQHRQPLDSEAVTCELRGGDVLLTTGQTYRSAAGSALSVSYAAGFVAEAEIQVLSNPPEIARHYPKRLQRLVGYCPQGEAVGYYGDWQHPINSFDLQPINWAEEAAEDAAASSVGVTGAKL